MIVLLNLGSLVLGLLALTLPAVNLLRRGKYGRRNWVTLSIMSISACAIALCLQILSINQRVRVADWSALMDTMNAVAFFSALLLAVTLILNTAALIAYRDSTAA